MKRPAAAASASPAKKPARRDPALGKLKAVGTALSVAEGYPEQVIQMFAATLEHSLLVPAPDRHESQNAVISMIGEVLASEQTRFRDQAAAMSITIAEADSSKVLREKAVAETAAAATAAGEALEASKAALKEAIANVATAQAALTEAKATQKTGDADLTKAGDRKAQLESCFTGPYEAAKQGADASALKAVLDTGKAFGFEAQLLTSAEAALAKAPAERGGFDGLVMEQMEQEFAKQIAALAATLSEGAAGMAERASKVEAAEKSVETATSHKELSKEGVDASQKALSEASSAAKAAEKALKEFGPEMAKAASALAKAESAVKVAEEVQAFYAELRDRTSAEPPEEPEPPAEAPADAEMATEAIAEALPEA